MTLTHDTILTWLKTTEPVDLEPLWHEADQVRKAYVGDAVHLRGLLEISNHCVRQCAYCGLASCHRDIPRYRMTESEIIEGMEKIQALGYGTVVMQAGEDYGLSTELITRVIRYAKTETDLAVTLSLGERPLADLETWKAAGADRYLLRFETSDPALYTIIHPSLPRDNYADRFAMLSVLKDLGYEVGSGVMIGIPGQSYDILARDLLRFQSLDLDMIGVGPYITDPKTPLAEMADRLTLSPDAQVPATELMVYKVIALTRLLCTEANIPSTTALATINRTSGREYGLMRGANVVMPNVTPVAYREQYAIYPGKACINETAEACSQCMRSRIGSIGREIGTGQGGRQRAPHGD